MRTHYRAEAACVAVLLRLCVSTWLVSASFPPAQNITWKSTNFKTVLSWGPEPTAEYSYTVEFAQLNKDRQRNPHCIQSSQTQCDLSSSLSDLQASYTADVLSEPPQGAPLELKEYPYTRSPPFCPYTDTLLLGPSFRLDVSPDQKRTTVQVVDPLTAVFRDGRQLSIRDVFGDELKYKVTYRRNKSTGKKVVTSRSSELVLSDLDPGESYCFQVQVLVPSRPTSSQLGTLSQTQCTHQRDPSLLDQYSLGVIVGAVLLPLLLVGGLIALIVICCLRRNKEQPSEKKETEALNV
ncbi:coagulation factor III, tissue factor a [Eucyclogobius newberryi]|uniref:coagulation factor III, tissue factor a n=1 Tax=Eucyclogobius newberryi TaxID=166745 RepID=UPI003B5A4187